MLRKTLILMVVVIVATLSAYGLSRSRVAQEVALNPSTSEDIPTLAPNLTGTPISASGLNVVDGPTAPFVIVGVSGTEVPDDVCTLKATTDFDVNVRLGPGAEFPIVGALQAGTHSLVMDYTENGWSRIRLSDELVGWVSPKVVVRYGMCDNLPLVPLASLTPNAA